MAFAIKLLTMVPYVRSKLVRLWHYIEIEQNILDTNAGKQLS